MAQCEFCGNSYGKSFEVVMEGVRHAFDSFECAIQALAVQCQYCGCRIVGHGMEVDGRFYCCAHCAKMSGTPHMGDRNETRPSP
jgi:hypothetical protein